MPEKPGLLFKSFLLFAGLLAVPVFSQPKKNIADKQSEVDSLRTELWKHVFTDAEKALSVGNEAIDKAKDISYSKGLADVYAKLGVLYDLQAKPEKALPFFLNAIRIQEEIRDSAGLSFSYNNLGLMYYAQYNYKEAYKYLSLSLQTDLQTGDRKRAAGAMVNLGIVNTYLDSVSRSLELYNKALGIYAAEKDTAGMMSCYTNIASVYFYKKEYKKALSYYQLNEAFLERSDNPEKQSSCYHTLANTWSKLKQFDKALEYAFKDLRLCEQHGLANRRQFAYENLNEIYLDKGDHKNAHVYLKKFVDLRDSLLNEDRNTTVAEMQAKYETEKKDKELLELNAEKGKEVAKRIRQRNLVLVAGVVFLLVFLLVLLSLRSRKRINKLLEEKNRLHEENIRQKEVLIAEVHHRVKNNLQLINSIVDLQSKSYTDAHTLEAVGDIGKRISAIALLHQFLYQKDAMDSVDMRSYLQELAEGLHTSFGLEKSGIELKFDIASFRLGITTAVPVGLIVNELITNAFKYAFEGRERGVIFIGLKKEQDLLRLEVSDNGLGMQGTGKQNFGERMISSLCRQLQAEWKRETSDGVKNVFLIKKFRQDG